LTIEQHASGVHEELPKKKVTPSQSTGARTLPWVLFVMTQKCVLNQEEVMYYCSCKLSPARIKLTQSLIVLIQQALD
jgi:hypothetical protein